MQGRLNEILMREAITLAWEYQTLALPNPSVGALIFDEKRGILTRGVHKKADTPHAELDAFSSAFRDMLKERGDIKTLNKLDSLIASNQVANLHEFLCQRAQGVFNNCVVFVSLEPCTHFGKTPPCAELLRVLKPRRVIIGAKDSTKEAQGGAKILQDNGIEVQMGICEKQAQELLYPFLCYQKSNAFRLFKLATRLNGDYTSGRISGEDSQIFTHNQRAVSQRIVLSSKTFMHDLPKLDCRFATIPFDSTHLPKIAILAREGFDTACNPHTNGRDIRIALNPSKLGLERGFSIIEGGFSLLSALREHIDMALLHIAPNFYTQHQFPSTSLPNALHSFSIAHLSHNQQDIRVWLR